MQKIKSKIFFLIIFFAFATRIFYLEHIQNYYFDEQYHIPAVKLILNGDVKVFEWWHDFSDLDYPLQNDEHAINDSNFDWLHPPFAKYFQAFFMILVGENAVGWRMASVVFGMAIVVGVYFFSRDAFGEKVGLIASFFTAMSGLMLVQSRIGMNDIFVSFWVLMSLYFYWMARRTHFALDVSKKLAEQKIFLLFSGLCLGFSVATKWSGIFILIYLVLFELIYFIRIKKGKIFRELMWSIYCLIIIPLVIYALSFVLMFLGGKNLGDFYNLHANILNYQLAGGGEHLYQSKPIDWLLNARSVWYWKGDVEVESGNVANIYLVENPLLVLGWVLVVFITFIKIFVEIKNRKKTNDLFNVIFIYFGYLFSFLPWMFSPRIMFYYHYLPAVALVNILLAYWVAKTFELMKKRHAKLAKILFLFLVLLLGGIFIIYYPQWVGLSVDSQFAEKVYFWWQGWR